MNTKGIKFLAVLAVLAMAFAVFAVVTDSDAEDAPETITAAQFFSPSGDEPYTDVKLGSTVTVKLLKDIELQKDDTNKAAIIFPATIDGTVYDKFVIDLNGHNITCDGGRAFWVKSGTVTITGEGFIKSTGDSLSNRSSVIRVGDASTDATAAAKLTIDNKVKITTDRCYAVSAFGYNTSGIELVVKGTLETTGEAGAIANNGTNTLVATTIDIESTAKVSSQYSNAIYHPGAGTLTIKGEVTGNGGIEMKAGTLFVKNGATITSTATGVSHTANGNGNSTSGYAIAGVMNNAYKAGVEMNLQGGEINGVIAILNDSETVAEGKVAPTFAITGGVFSDFSVLKYTNARSTGASVDAGGMIFNGAAAKTDADIKDAMLVETTLHIKNADLTSGTNIFDFSISKLASITNIVFDDAVDRNVVFLGVDSKDITANVKVNSGAVAFYGFKTVSGDVNKEGTTAPVVFQSLVGAVALSNGNMNVDLKSGAGQTITVAKGQELMLSGKINAALNIAGAGKVTIDSEKTLEVLAAVDATGVAVDVKGKITGELGDTAPKGTLTVGALEAFDGAVIENVTVSATSAVAWSGSDINFAKLTPEQWTGKDAANGTWSVKKQSDVLKLTLNNYQGTYNFLPFMSGKVEVIVAGDVAVSYAPVKYINNYFNADFTTLQDKGTFTLAVDLSQAEYPVKKVSDTGDSSAVGDNKTITVMSVANSVYAAAGNAAYITAGKIETVGMNIAVTGTPAWTAAQLKNFPVIGLLVGGLNDNALVNGELYSAPIDIDVLSDEGYGLGIGAGIIGKVTNCSMITANGSVCGIAMKAEVKDTQITGLGSLVDVLFDGKISSNSSIAGETVYVTGATIEQESTIDAANLVIAGDTTNNGTIKASGMSIIWKSADLENYAVFENSGKMGVFGTITNYPGLVENTAGVINNTGEIIFHSKMFDSNGGKISYTIAGTPEKSTAESKIKLTGVTVDVLSLSEIIFGYDADDFKTPQEMSDYFLAKDIAFDMDGVEALIDGNVPVKLTIDSFVSYKAEGATAEKYADYKCNTVFKGTMYVDSEGFSVDVKDGSTTIGFSKVNGKPSLDVSGTVTITETLAEGSTATPKTANVTLEGYKTVSINDEAQSRPVVDSGCEFVAEAGIINSTGSFVLDSASSKVTIQKNATFNGDMSVYGMVLNIAGTFNGNVNAPAVKLDGTMIGDIAASGNITAPQDVADFAIVDIAATGELNGNIASDGNVNLAGKVTGNIEMFTEGSKITVTGTTKASVTYSGEYISAKATKEGETDTVSEFEVKFDIDAALTEGSVVINMMASTPADETNAGVPGYIAFETDAAIKGKAQTTVTAGALKFGASYAVPTGYEIVIEQGAILEVAKSTVLDVTKAALKVNKQATMNYNNDDFGEVKFIMSLETAAGYIIYSNIAYALANCDENSVLTLGADGAIDADADVMKGVKLIVADGLELTINADINLTMQDGAKFVIEGTGSIVIKATNVEDKKENSVSGVFEFDGNVVEFENAVFADDAELAGIKETADTPSMLDVDVNYYGKMIAVSGNITGDITLVADNTKTDKDGKVIKNFGALDVAADATISNAQITDASYHAYAEKDAEKAKQVWSIITVDGKIIASDLTINGEYAGNGQVIVAEDGAVSIKDTAILNVQIADVNGNGYEFVGVEFSVIEIESSKLSADYIVKIKGTLVNGQINALKDAYLDGLTIGYQAEKEVTPATGGDNDGAGETDPTMTGKAIIPADNTFEAVFVADKTTILDTTYAYGKLKTKTLVDEDKKLVYDATYADGDYTVYTHFLNIDQSEVTDITVDGNALSKNLGEKDLVIAGINLTIADKTVLVLKNNMIVGTPRTTLGAGTTVIGNIIIPTGKFVLVYYDADVTAANFYGSYQDNTEKDMSKYPVAVTSAFDIEGSPYAVAYANANDVVLDTVAKAMKPAIAGYTFTQWTAYNGAKLDAAKVGETDVTATLVAGKVTINATAYEGVAYYCNGVEFMTTGMDVQVDVGSVFTAKIVDKDKLEGSPLVNGAASFKVVDEYTVLEISGVTEKKAPSNDDDDDDGLGLTEILLIVLVVLIAVMCVILILRLNRS
jgi:hypothetical protein